MEKLLLTKKEFKEIMQVLPKVSKEEFRPILQGVCFNNNEVVALDGFRLSIRRFKGELSGEYIIHAKDLKEVLNTCKRDMEHVEIIFDNKTIFNLLDKGKNLVKTFECKYLDGLYIAYKSLLNNSFAGIIELKDTKELLDIIKPLKKNQGITLEIEDNKLSIYNVVADLEKIESHLYHIGDIEINNKIKLNITIGVNATYLKEAIKDYKTCDIKYNGKLQSIVIESAEEKNKYELVLPLRILKGIEKAS